MNSSIRDRYLIYIAEERITSMIKKAQPNISAEDVDALRRTYGTNNLDLDDRGNIIDRKTGSIVHPYRSPEDVRSQEKQKAKEFFYKLPVQVKKELVKQSLEHLVNIAKTKMDNYYPATCDSDERWNLSYKELSDITAEGIILGDK